MDDLEYAGLSHESWRLLIAIIETGQMTLKDGTIREASTREILMTARYVASLKPPRQTRVNLPEWEAPVTRVALLPSASSTVGPPRRDSADAPKQATQGI